MTLVTPAFTVVAVPFEPRRTDVIYKNTSSSIVKTGARNGAKQMANHRPPNQGYENLFERGLARIDGIGRDGKLLKCKAPKVL